MKETITVSVLVAVYNPNMIWLEELLQSILEQSFQDFEVCVLDDCSTEVDFEKISGLCRSIFKKQKNLFIGRNERNVGSNKTFEKLVKGARGKYLAFCDQDDIWEPQKLECLIHALEDEHAVMAYCDMSVIDRYGVTQYRSLQKMRPGLVFAQGKDQTAYYIMDNCTAACSMLVHTQAVYHAVPFPEHICCDQWMAACVSAQGRIAFVNKPLVRYRRHGTNQTMSLGHLEGKEDYFYKRVQKAYHLVKELQRRHIHYRYEEDVYRFAEARIHRNLYKIWAYRRFSRKTVFLDLLVLGMPNSFVKQIFALWKKWGAHKMQNGRAAARTAKDGLNITPVVARRGKDAVPIVMSANRAYVPVLSVCIHSIAMHADPMQLYHICIFHTDIPHRDAAIIKQEFSSANFYLQFINVSKYVQGYKLNAKGLITTETYYRFLIPHLLCEYDKAVYLDIDTVVCRDLAQLYHIPLHGCLLGAVPEIDLIAQYHGANPDTKQYCDRVLQLQNPDGYFQAGVLLWNVSAWKKCIDCNRLFAMAEHGNFRYSDQDILNIICQGQVQQLGMEWNVLTENTVRRQVISHAPDRLLAEYRQARKQPGIIHYAGSHKPWKELKGDFATEFWKAARATPYYEQLIYEMYNFVINFGHPSVKQRAGEQMRKAAKKILPQSSSLRRIIADVYWRLK